MAHFGVGSPIVDSGSYIGVDAWLKIDLRGARTLAPDLRSNVDVYKVRLFLSTDGTLSGDDREVGVAHNADSQEIALAACEISHYLQSSPAYLQDTARCGSKLPENSLKSYTPSH